MRIILSLILEILKTTFPVPIHWPIAQASIIASKFWVLKSLAEFSHQVFLHSSQIPPVKTHSEELRSMSDHLQYCIWILVIKRNISPEGPAGQKHPENGWYLATVLLKSSQGRKENIFLAIQISRWVNTTIVDIWQEKTRFNNIRI